MTIKALYFDLGGVILRTEDKTPRTQLAAEFGLTYNEMDKVVFGGGLYGSAARASPAASAARGVAMAAARAEREEYRVR